MIFDWITPNHINLMKTSGARRLLRHHWRMMEDSAYMNRIHQLFERERNMDGRVIKLGNFRIGKSND